MGARVMDGVVVGAESIVAAGAVVTGGMKVPPRSLVAGVPAVIKRQIGDKDLEFIDRFWRNYIVYKDVYLYDIPGL
jgi:carbonic anhydrase/acetyltransferase-like protein (isoleucine patch superfamily)